MKTFRTISIALFTATLFTNAVNAQTPEGYTLGSITLSNGNTLNGFIKENIGKKASISFMESASAKKKSYDGWALNAAKINNQEYLCVKGDFYTVHSSGELYFLQKNSNAVSKISYNGSEPVLMNPVEGKAGDFFLYNSKTLAISLVDKSSYDNVVNTSLGTYEPAVKKAQETKADLAQLKIAVDLYNQRPSR
jgi:hypothetical protein